MLDDEEEKPETKAELDGFPDAEQITNLLGDDFEMPTITTIGKESAPSAEPEPIDDPETGESYFDDETEQFARPNEDGERSVEKDEKGRPFDLQLHAVDENGNPKQNKKGYWVFLRKDKRGNVDMSSTHKAEHFETALLYFDGGTDLLAGVLGDHWKPTNEDQRKSVARSIGKYLESENAPVLTPKQEMLLKLGTYSAPRVVHTDTLDNFKLLCLKTVRGVKSFWQTITGKKKPRREAVKPEPVPQAEEIPNNEPSSFNSSN